jgi:hypothetical protein
MDRISRVPRPLTNLTTVRRKGEIWLSRTRYLVITLLAAKQTMTKNNTNQT